MDMNPLKPLGALVGKPVEAAQKALNRPTSAGTPHSVANLLLRNPKLEEVLRDRVVMITGASSGIGEAAALQLGRAGGTVILVARGEEKLRETAARVAEVGGTAYVYPCDLTDMEAIDRM